jgi:hypothetical protein
MPQRKPDNLKALSQTEAAALLGRSCKWLRDRPDLFADCRDAAGRYNAPQLVAAFVDHNRKEAVRQAEKAPRADTSPALERWREARATEAELKVQKLAGELVPLEAMEQFHNREAALWIKSRERIELLLDGVLLERVQLIYDDFAADLQRVADEMFLDPEQPNESE